MRARRSRCGPRRVGLKPAARAFPRDRFEWWWPSRPAAEPTSSRGSWRRDSASAGASRWWWKTAPAPRATSGLYGKLPFDINKDFSSITMVGTAPMVVIASPAFPAKTLGQLIEYARARPGAVKFGSSGIGTPVHLAGELMMQLTGIKMVHVPYKGIAPAMTAILAGEIEITYVAVLTGLQHFKAGKLSPLAVAGRSRYPALPDVPTAAEAGLAGYEIDFWYALLGPAGMPAPLVARIQRDAAAILTTPEMKESLLAQGCVAAGGGPEELSTRIRSDYELWGKVIRTAGVKLE
ncbi:MAG: tripartite tricarboxylate transporter substrate binding protein [Betaproteobacteria bacterium]|nr:MAG: tripartite tricarboxylate transporter substrate binding protein [Betaproteobacteria bacterium]